MSNRSNALDKIGEHEASLRDAEAAVNARPDWAKGYFRKGSALQKLDRHEEAFVSLFQCVTVERNTKADQGPQAIFEAAKSLMYVLDKSRQPVAAAAETTTTTQKEETFLPKLPSVASCSSLGNLSYDSGVGSSVTSHSSLTSLASSSRANEVDGQTVTSDLSTR